MHTVTPHTIQIYVWDTCTVHTLASLSAGFDKYLWSYHKEYSAVRFQACIMIIEKVGVSFHNDSLEKWMSIKLLHV
jgi:hypothetical protein